MTHRLSMGILAVSLAALLAPTPSAGKEPSQGVEKLLTRYLEAQDDREAERLLGQIEKEGLSLKAAQEILARGKRYKTEKTGAQPGLPVMVGGEEMSYALYVPAGYDTGTSYPLVICLHGAGFSGDSYLERWQPRLGERYLLACPSLDMGAWWTDMGTALVLRVLEDVARTYHIDRNRVYLTGMSNGGIGAFKIGIQFADRFAGIAPMAGGVPDPFLPLLEDLRNTPVYIIHGKKDEVMPVELSRAVYQRLSALGYDVTFREHDLVHPQAGGHFFPKEELPALVAWLDKKVRNPYPRKVTCVRTVTASGTCYWVRADKGQTAVPAAGPSDEPPEHPRIRFLHIEAEIAGENTIRVTEENVRQYTLFFHDTMVDVTRPLTVLTNGQVSFRGKITEGLPVLLGEARVRKDPAMLFTASATIQVPTEGEKR